VAWASTQGTTNLVYVMQAVEYTSADLARLWREVQDLPATEVDIGSEHLLSRLCQLTGADRAQWDLIGSLPNGKSTRMAAGDWIGPLNPNDITALTGPESMATVSVHDNLRIYFTLTRRAEAPEFTPAQTQLLALTLAGLSRWLHWLALSYGPVSESGALPPHQRKVLLMLVTGRSEKQIAAELNLSTNTTHQYVTAIFRRFGVRNRPSLITKWLASA
jgi:DNA-binding CsgD family transcriptional regulator